MSKEEKKQTNQSNQENSNVDVTLEPVNQDPVESEVLDEYQKVLKGAMILVEELNNQDPSKTVTITVEDKTEDGTPAIGCMPIQAYSNVMLNRYKASSKIRVDWSKKVVSTEDGKIIDRLLQYIRYFNNVHEDTTLIFDKPLEDITVINEFADFLRPLAVRVNVLDRRGRNLIHPARRSELDWKLKGFSFEEFEDLQIRFRNILRKDADQDRISLASAMKPLNLYDIMDKVSVNGMCASYDKPYIPIVIDEAVGNLFMKGRYYLVAESQILEDYLRDWLK